MTFFNQPVFIFLNLFIPAYYSRYLKL